MFAVVSHNGKSYKFEIDHEYNVDLIPSSDKKEFVFAEVSLISDEKENVKIGQPFIDGASVTAEIIGTARGKKVCGVKFKPKKRYMRTLGHREDYTKVKIQSIKS